MDLQTITAFFMWCTIINTALMAFWAVLFLAAPDLVIRGGTVFDGLGGPGRVADVVLAGGRVVEVSEGAAIGRVWPDQSGPGSSRPRVPVLTGCCVATGTRLSVLPKRTTRIRRDPRASWVSTPWTARLLP